LKNLIQKIDHVLNIHVEETILIKRLIERAQNSGRKDDTEEVIINRQQVYTKLTTPLIDFYKNEIIQINGDGSINQVTQHILEQIQ